MFTLKEKKYICLQMRNFQFMKNKSKRSTHICSPQQTCILNGNNITKITFKSMKSSSVVGVHVWALFPLSAGGPCEPGRGADGDPRGEPEEQIWAKPGWAGRGSQTDPTEEHLQKHRLHQSVTRFLSKVIHLLVWSVVTVILQVLTEHHVVLDPEDRNDSQKTPKQVG